MAQWKVYRNRNVQTCKQFPLLLDVQSDLLSDLQSCVAVPLMTYNKNSSPTFSRLTPVINIDNADYLMLTPQLAGIHRKELGDEVADLSAQRIELMNAVDFLLTGF